ncbi:hypothetical protein [Roseivivax sp. CAU 1761]
MRVLVIAAATLALAAAGAARAEAEADKAFRLTVPRTLAETGLLDHILPRFSLKTATRITRQPAPDGAAAGPGAGSDAAFGATGRPVFAGPNRVWHLELGDDPDARAFGDWLESEAGRAAVAGFAPEGTAPFTPVARAAEAAPAPELEGDAAQGAALAQALCGRCHAVREADRLRTIGSTPSFMLLRGFPDWLARFRGFYALNPHPAFTQVAEVTPPFPANRPPPIVPLAMTLDDLDHILAFVETVAPADLGAPMAYR